ncbi:MAG: hypothetical protein OXD30_11955 [Bryobacterales bacterium]|nr:hypothetical protein [Bryobacterales bacterium]
MTYDIEDLGGREKLRRYPWPRMIACLATLAITLPLAAENPSRSSASHVDDRAGRFPCGSKLTLGLLGGFTLTPDYRTGFLGIDRVGTIKYEVETALGVPPLEVHDVHSASYSRPDSSRPILGAFAETALTYSVSLQVAVLFRELARATEIVWSEPNHFLYSESEGLHYADFARLPNKRTDIWEFPVMLKYRFAPLAGKAAKVRPFVGAGPAFWIENNRRPAVRVLDPHHGVVAGIGLDMQRRGWTLSPQVSYTRWATDADPHLSKNQIQVLIGLSF